MSDEEYKPRQKPVLDAETKVASGKKTTIQKGKVARKVVEKSSKHHGCP